MRKHAEFYNSQNEFKSGEYLKYLGKVFKAAADIFSKKTGGGKTRLGRIFAESGLFVKDFKQVIDKIQALSNEIINQNKEGNPFNEESIQTKFQEFQNAFSEWQKSVPSNKLMTIMKKFKDESIKLPEKESFSLSEFFEGGPLNIVSKTVMDAQFISLNPDPQTKQENLEGNTMIELPVNEELFPAGSPCEGDVKQTIGGACYMLGPLRSLAGQNPDYIKRMFTDHKNGMVTVRFPGYGDVTIQKSVSKRWEPDAKPWVRLLEKAYVATGLKNAPVKGEDGIEHYDMNNVGWHFENEFLDAITSRETELQYCDEDYVVEPTIEDSRKRLGEMLLEAKRKHATISAAYSRHIIEVEDVIERFGTVYIKTYDQLYNFTRYFTMESLLNSKCSLERLSFQVIQGEPPYKFSEFATKDFGKFIEDRNASLKENRFEESFLSLIKNAMNGFQGGNVSDTQREAKTNELLANSQSLKELLKREFEKLPKELKNKDFSEMTAQGNPFRKAMIHKMRKAVLKDLPADSQESSVQNIRNFFSQPKLFENSELMKDEFTKPFKHINKPPYRSHERLQELRRNIRESYEFLEEKRIDRFGKNSVEYVAMTDSLRDLNAVMKDPNADAQLVNYLMERAYVKCNYYQKNKNPYTPSGRARKNAALKAMRNIELINPTIRSDVMKDGNEKTLLEMACIRAKKSMELRMSAYRNKYHAIADLDKLRDCITEEFRRPELMNLAKQIRNENSWAVFEKMCQKEPRVAMRNFMNGRLNDLNDPQNKRSPEAVKATEDHLQRSVEVELQEGEEEVFKLP